MKRKRTKSWPAKRYDLVYSWLDGEKTLIGYIRSRVNPHRHSLLYYEIRLLGSDVPAWHGEFISYGQAEGAILVAVAKQRSKVVESELENNGSPQTDK